MNNTRSNGPDSPSSDERMDTFESFQSKQDTPESVASDFDDNETDVLRLQSPENPVLRLTNDTELNDSLISKMSTLRLNSVDIPEKPSSLPLNPKSTLTTAIDHPLMGLGSPDSVENYPDVVPKKQVKEDLSLSSIEDDKNELNLNSFYEPQRNTSKNNLYFSEHFTTAESIFDTTESPDLTRMKRERRKIMCLKESTPRVEDDLDEVVEDQGWLDVPEREVFHTGVAEWCESPSHLRTIPNFELPIEMDSNVGKDDDPEAPDLLSSPSREDDRSLYCAAVDPRGQRVQLRPRSDAGAARRRVAVPHEDSLDSLSGLSSDDEDAEDPRKSPAPERHSRSDDENDDQITSMSSYSDPIPELSAAEEFAEERAWLKVPLPGGKIGTCDMKVIEPYKRVLSHGGYTASGCAILVLSACHLPPSSRPDYNYVMTHLFLYVLWSIERLVTEQYALVYLGGAARRSLPTWRWLHECYHMIDRRLRKNLKHLYLVHPTFWLKSIVILCKPFVSSKFFSKISYVKNLHDLMEKVPVEPNAIPDLVKDYDSKL